MQNNSLDEGSDAAVENVVVEDTAENSAGRIKFYEVGYVLLSSIAKEKVVEEVLVIKDFLAKAGAKIVAHGEPELTPLAYVMTKKIHGANHRFDEGYFGWIKFELSAGAIAQVKKALDADESILRYLLMITVKENIYLGKRAPVYVAGAAGRDAGIIAPEAVTQTLAPTESVLEASAVPAGSSVAPSITAASVEEIDKSIDAMVKLA